MNDPSGPLAWREEPRGGRGNRRRGAIRPFAGLLLALALLVLGGLVALMFTSVPGKVKRGLRELIAERREAPPAPPGDEAGRLRERLEQELRAEMEADFEAELARLRQELETGPEREPEVPRHELGSIRDVRQLRSGIPFESELLLEDGRLASVERVDAASYVARYQLSVRLPQPSTTLPELESVNPQLGSILPGLGGLLESATVSPRFHTLYRNKTERLRRNLHSLNELETKHNLFDCETILHLESASGRKVYFLQAEMDVVSDGSDGDRLPVMPDEIVNSTHYQPTTSYGWPKQTRTPNPLIEGLRRRIGNAEREIADSATTSERRTWLRNRKDFLERTIEELTYRSHLIAEYDPFIVIPMDTIVDGADPFAPRAGDYAVVIYEDRVFPAIVGDAGPTFKVGEASLRLAREINSNATPYSRPVSDLTVSYVVFPNSRESRPRPPDYDLWHERCSALLEEIGGLGEGFELHRWEDLLAAPAEEEAADDAEPTEAAAARAEDGNASDGADESAD